MESESSSAKKPNRRAYKKRERKKVEKQTGKKHAWSNDRLVPVAPHRNRRQRQEHALTEALASGVVFQGGSTNPYRHQTYDPYGSYPWGVSGSPWVFSH